MSKVNSKASSTKRIVRCAIYTRKSTDEGLEPFELTPQERRQEVAAILARGVLRLREHSQPPSGSDHVSAAGKSPESRRDCLDEGPKSGPHVSGG
jgi:hypothetical protein